MTERTAFHYARIAAEAEGRIVEFFSKGSSQEAPDQISQASSPTGEVEGRERFFEPMEGDECVA